MATTTLRSPLERRLADAVRGEVAFDPFSRGRYATDASHYQVMPKGVVVAAAADDVPAVLEIAREAGVAVTARGGGTSQSGQTVNGGLVVDTSKHLNRLLELDVPNRRCVVEPGLVLDELNRLLKPHGLWFPVDVSTSSRATLGGMAGNNSCGGRSLRYGTMRDNVRSLDAVLADGTALHFGEVDAAEVRRNRATPDGGLFRDLLDLGEREAAEIRARTPEVQRRVGGYGLETLVPNGGPHNLAHLLVGSEGTLAFTTKLELKLSPLLGSKVMGVCHFGSFHAAMDAAQHLVTLGPIAIELVDRTMIALARDIPMYRATVDDVVRGEPAAILIVEFAEEADENRRRLRQLGELMGDLGFGWDRAGAKWGGVVELVAPQRQAALTEMRQGGLNIMMSMKEARKPVSFVEDCAVPLEHLADYTAKLTEVFERHGTTGTWYAHASVGCLHVRPVLNLKLDQDVKAMRAIAEEAFALVRAYKGSHSGEHGDGLVRSEFHEAMFGRRMVESFEAVKDRFDPAGLLNPGRIVRAPKMDDRTLFRYPPDYQPATHGPALDWSPWPTGFQGAVEMCNNNGACRKVEGGVMCPSYRVTRNERDVVRGRANALRLALSGQLGNDALSAPEMAETMALCVSCKACRRECPTGVDMARMKIEVQAARIRREGLGLRDRVVAYLPRYAPWAARLRGLVNAGGRAPGAGWLAERVLGLSAKRSLPRWQRPFELASTPGQGRRVALLADTFNTYFEPANLEAAVDVLAASGFAVELVRPGDGGRPLCCGRTFLASGLVDEAKAEAKRTLDALAPLVDAGVPIVGLEPSCLFTMRDELAAMWPGARAEAVGEAALLFEEFLARELAAGLTLPLAEMRRTAHLHGHCHQKAFGAMGAVETVLRAVPGLEVRTIASSCCGMAGAFGYQRETIDVSLAMAELALAPAVRAAEQGALIVADGTSCRHQIHDTAGREALHVARVLQLALATGS
ncbi:MAG: FAD-binding oxidoreductase [Geminicoccaceae bacterium]|nr:MAG: FAD-binding oxidoreductase [Geminicoccaceae bacterium]